MTKLGGLLDPLGGDKGIDDTALLLAVWPYADNATKTYWAVGAYAFLPTGSYDDKLGCSALEKTIRRPSCRRLSRGRSAAIFRS